MSRQWALRLALLAAAALPFTALSPAVSSGSEQPASTDEEAAAAAGLRRGALTYRLHCQACHGAAGRGDGPLAADLKRPPPDLSLLASRAGGAFPAAEVRSKIDGRDPVASHGPSEMPVWGLTFALRGDHDRHEVARRIDDLVALLRSWQRPSDPADG